MLRYVTVSQACGGDSGGLNRGISDPEACCLPARRLYYETVHLSLEMFVPKEKNGLSLFVGQTQVCEGSYSEELVSGLSEVSVSPDVLYPFFLNQPHTWRIKDTYVFNGFIEHSLLHSLPGGF